MTDGNANSSTNIFFTLYNQSGLPWDFTILIFIRCLFAVIGAFLNCALFLVTIKTNYLFGTCNFLIGFNALCASISSPFMLIGLGIVLVQIDFINIWTCFWLQILPMLFGNLFTVSMLAIGVDRLLSIIFPVWHTQRNIFLYLGLFLAISFLYAFFVIYLAFIGITNNSNALVLCASPGEVYSGEIGDILFRMSLVVISLTIFAYSLLWLLLRMNQAKVNGTFTQKIMKSLVCILLVIIFGYFTSVSAKIITRLFTPYLPLSLSQIAYFTFVTSILSTIAKGLNAPILFFFSQDYRRAFRKQFPRIFPPSNSITHTSNAQLFMTRVGVAGNNFNNQQNVR